jgi:hypothetical protein
VTGRAVRTDRRRFLVAAGTGGAALLLAGCDSGGAMTAAAPAVQPAELPPAGPGPPLRRVRATAADRELLLTAQVAEALAVTTYSGIVDRAPFFRRLAPAFQTYVAGAREEEMSHYLLEQRLTGRAAPVARFFYPPGMFREPRTTLETLVALEDAFIAAYLLAVRRLSTPDLRVTAARILGVESEHRALARVIARNIAEGDGGSLSTLRGLQAKAEPVLPPNNNAYERTLRLERADQVAGLLERFTDRAAAEHAGFDVSNPLVFRPFDPTLPEPLGDFGSLAG